MLVILRIIRIALRHKWYMAGAYAGMLGAAAAYLVLPRFIGDAVESVADSLADGGLPERSILFIALAIVGLYAIRGALSFWQAYFGEALSQLVAYDVRNTFYDHVQHLGYEFHDRQHTGNLMSRAITDVEGIRMFINMGLIRTPYFACLFIAVAAILLKMDWRLGLLSVSFMPVVAFQSAVVRLKMRHIWLRVQEGMADLSVILQENLTGVRVVRAFASEEYEKRKFGSKSVDITADMIEVERLRASNTSLMLFTYQVSLGLIIWFGGSRVMNGNMGIGELTQFLIYMQILSMPVRMVGWLVNSYARAVSAGQRLFEILDVKSSVFELPNAMIMPQSSGRISLRNLSFRYDEDRDVLRDINLEIEPGQVVAFLGSPGSGKSTLANLIPRFYDPPPGSVIIDGIDVRDVTLASLRKNIGIVEQDVVLFTATIRENIAYGREDATTEDIVRAAKVAQLHDFIQGLDHGYDTMIGERGSTLSGGQRQRLSIARAILLDPPILILDDSTSSVDSNTEKLIRIAMESVMRGRTTLVVAHRLSTVHKADAILVLKDGRVVEQGIHRELLDIEDGLYRQIYELQLRPQEEAPFDMDEPPVLLPRAGLQP